MIMSLGTLSDMLSQRSGIEQSIAGSVINVVIGHIMHHGGIGNLFSQGNNYSDNDRIGGIQSALSQLTGDGGGELQKDHPLVQSVQQNAGIQDPRQAIKYAQQALSLINEHGNNNPQGLHSLFSKFIGGLRGGGEE